MIVTSCTRMNTFMRFSKSLLFTALLIPVISFSQVRKQYMSKYSSVGFGGGSAHYFGDLAQYSKPFRSITTLPRWSGTIQYTRYINPRLMARASFSWIRLVGDDYTYSTRKGVVSPGFENNFNRNLHFRNDVKEFTGTALYNLIPQYNRSSSQRDYFMPYALIGFGFYAHDPQARVRFREYNADAGDPTKPLPTWVSLKNLNTGGQGQTPSAPVTYSAIQVVMPVGLGVRWRLGDNIDLTLEGAFRFTPFDYLDDVGSGYANPLDLASLGTPLIPVNAGFLPNNPNPSTIANISQVLSNRTLEVIAARLGKDRSPAYGSTSNGYFFDPSTRKAGYKADGTLIATASRFSPRWDSYATVQVALHFLLNSGVKCPPVN